jgi:manganese/iron transport system permease protein
MWELLNLSFFRAAIVAAFLAGVCCSIIGVWMVLLKCSLIGVAIAHAAFAGALLGILLGKPPMPFAMGFSVLAAALLGPLSDRGNLDPDSSTGVIFSAALGLAFLFLGLIPDARSVALGFLWGNILLLNRADILLLGICTILVVVVTGTFFRPVQAVIFDRDLAKAVGIPATIFFYLLLFLSGAGVASCLKSVGGLLVYSLIINPAAAAYQITYSLKKMYLLAALFGIVSGWGGIAASVLLHLPTGATIVLMSCFVLVIANIFSPKKKHGRAKKIL